MCLSFPRQKVQLETGRRNVKEVPLNGFPSTHQNFLSKYLSTIHPAIVGTNFADKNPSHWLWRRYFSFLKYPFPMVSDYLNHPNRDYKFWRIMKPPSPQFGMMGIVPKVERPIFPLATIQFHRDKRPSRLQSKLARFPLGFPLLPGKMDVLRQRINLSSVVYVYNDQPSIRLKWQFFAKHCNTIMDLYDDWATLQVAEAQKHVENYFAGETVDRYGLLVQSWIDTKTVLPRKPDKKIFNEQGKLVAKVHIDNLEHFYMPTSNYPLKVSTSHKDHSKWAISFALDTFNTDGTLADNDALSIL